MSPFRNVFTRPGGLLRRWGVPNASVSVIIPTLGREQVLVDTLRSVLQQLPEDGELLVVDQTERHDEATDAQLADLTAHDDRLSIARVVPASTTAARNFGLAHTTADIVVYFDDDVLLEPGCLQAHRAAHDEFPEAGGVVGRVQHPGEAVAPSLYCMDDYGRESGTFNWLAPSAIGTVNGANMSFKRAAIEGVGGFDTSFTGNGWREESDAALRVVQSGWSLRFVPAAHLMHLANPSGGARAFGSDYYASSDIYQNETLFFLRRFGVRRLPVLTVKLVRRGIIRRSALRDRSVGRRAAALFTGVREGIRLHRTPRRFAATPRQ